MRKGRGCQEEYWTLCFEGCSFDRARDLEGRLVGSKCCGGGKKGEREMLVDSISL